MIVKFLLLFATVRARYGGYYGTKSDSRMPDVLYQMLFPENVFLGGSVSGKLLSNPWINGTDDRCDVPPPPECNPEVEDCVLTLTTPHYGGTTDILNCDLLPSDFFYTVKLSLEWSQYPEDVKIAEETITVRPNSDDQSASFSLDVPVDVEKSKPSDYASLKLNAITMLANGSEIPNTQQETYLTLKKTDQLLIQSDKAKYKPGNTVQFRIIALNQDLMGLEASISYEIKSPSHNMMAQGDSSTDNGVVQGRFQFDVFAEQGEWEIKVTATTPTDTVESTYKFDVEEYVLPKFEVIITGDSFLVENDGQDYPFNVEAKYTFGKPVPGNLEVVVKKLPCEIPYWYHPQEVICMDFEECPIVDENGCPASPSITQTFPSFTGSEANSVPADELSQIFNYESQYNYHCNCGKTLLMEVTMTDAYSGEVQTAQKVIKVETTRYKVQWLYEPPLPRPDVGMKYIGKVTLIDGSSLDLNGNLLIKVNKGYRDEYDEEIINQSVNAADSDGIFTVDIPERFLTESSFSVSVSFTTNYDSFDASVSSYYSNYNSDEREEELRITADVDGKLVPNTVATFTITSNYEGKATFYAIARGRIVHSEKLDVEVDGSQTVELSIDSSMIPEARFLIVENMGEGWVADSVSYFVEETLDNQVEITASSKEVQVGETINIDVTAAEESPVYFLGVDQSVLLLKSGNDIDKKKVLEVLQETQEGSWRPWPIWGGCGMWFPWSYGNGAVDKINDAGLSILSVRSVQDLGST
jgi:CD109 antigen